MQTMWMIRVLLQQFWASRHPYRYLTANEIAERFKFECHLGIAQTEALSKRISADVQDKNVSTHIKLSVVPLSRNVSSSLNMPSGTPKKVVSIKRDSLNYNNIYQILSFIT